MAGPISPKEAKSGKHIPDEVFEVFNDLIREGGGTVKQGVAVARISAKMGVTRSQIFERGWLDVEDAYRAKGWKVDFDKPGFNESYEAYFTFEAKR